MTPAAYNAFCGALPAAHHVVQWGDAEVWKVGEKVFAIGRIQESGEMAISFKCSPMAFDILRERPGLRPAPYLASRGMKWIQWLTPASMPDAALQDYLRESHCLVALGLTRRMRAELGLS